MQIRDNVGLAKRKKIFPEIEVDADYDFVGSSLVQLAVEEPPERPLFDYLNWYEYVIMILTECTSNFLRNVTVQNTKNEKYKEPSGVLKEALLEKGGFFSRVKSSKSGFDISYIVNYGARVNDNALFDKQTAYAVKMITTIFGKDFWDLTKYLDVVVPTQLVLDKGFVFEGLPLDKNFTRMMKDLDWEDKDIPIEFAKLKKNVKGFRFISPVSTKTGIVELKAYTPDNAEYNPSTILNAKNYEDISQLVGAVMNLRLFDCFAELHVGKAEASFITQQEQPQPQYLLQWLEVYSAGLSKQDYSHMVNPITNIVASNKLTALKIKPSKKTNEDDLLLDSEATFQYIPTIDRSKQYFAQIEKDGLTDKGEFTRMDSRYQLSRVNGETVTLMPNRIIYTDWVNGKFTYTNTSGALSVLDLEDSIPVKDTHSFIMFARSIMHEKSTQILADMAYCLSYYKENGGKINFPTNSTLFLANSSAYEYLLESLKNSLNLDKFCSQIFQQLQRKTYPSDMPLKQQEIIDSLREEYGSSAAFTMQLLTVDSPFLELRGIAVALTEAHAAIDKKILQYLESGSIINNMARFGALRIYAKNVSNLSAIRRKFIEEREIYLNPPLEDNKTYVPDGIPLIDGIFMLPHQCKVFNYLKNAPPNAVLAVDAGGGKTILILADILQNLEKGFVTKPLVLCPSHLVKDYISEASFMTKGKLNVVPITSAVMKAWDEDDIKALCKSAPINTVFITDYDFIKGKMSRKIPYGTRYITIGKNLEFLKEIGFNGLWVDESHYMKNASSGRSIAGRKLAYSMQSEDPKVKILKRLASGTLTPDSMSDLPPQSALMDPTVFGSVERFNETYGERISGKRVMSWKPGAEKEVNEAIRANCNFNQIKRKEWAALLPTQEENFYFAEMTPNQSQLYDAILKETLETIRSNEELMKKLKEGAEDETVADGLESLLYPYLQRLEQFLTSPGEDELGEKFLKNDVDKRSPKIGNLVARYTEHKARKMEGKILVFCSYIKTAETLYNQLPPAVKARTVLYKSANKFADLEKFKSNPDIDMLIGVEFSLNTGTNLQFCSRLVRIESVWTPGLKEQGESRVMRPELKKKDSRKFVALDWILVNRSIDVTKISRLIAKIISVVKFENHNNWKYTTLPELDLVKMNLDAIASRNDAQTTLGDYFTGYGKLRAVVKEEYVEYLKDPNVRKEPVPLAKGKILAGSRLLKHIPYIPAMKLYGVDELGIIPFFEWAQTQATKGKDVDPKGLMIHTDHGEGECVGTTKKGLKVKLDGRRTITVDNLSAFVITKKAISTKKIRDQLAGLVGLPVDKVSKLPEKMIPIKEEEPKEEDDLPVIRPKKKQELPLKPAPKSIKKLTPTLDTKENQKLYVYDTILNGYPGLSVDCEDPDSKPELLGKLGFKRPGPYVYSSFAGPKAMVAFIDMLEKRFTVKSSYINQLRTIAEQMRQGGGTKLERIKAVDQTEFKNFYKLKFQIAGPNEVRPYPIIQDQDVFVMFDVTSQPASKKVRSYKIPGVQTFLEKADWMQFFKSKSEIINKIREIQDAGVKIRNLGPLMTNVKAMRK